MNLNPTASRQLNEDGIIVFWRDGVGPGSRQGLACILSMCPNPECTCKLIYINGCIIDERANEICRDEDRVHVKRKSPEGFESDDLISEWMLSTAVDPSSGEIVNDPDFPDGSDSDLIEWLVSEINGELLDLLYCFRARLSGCSVEQPSEDIDLDYVEAGHLAAFGDLFDCVREDEYLLNGRRYWTCIYLCPNPNCDCHEARVVFFDDADDSGAGVGWAYLDISGPVGIHIMKMSAERDAPEDLIKELWKLFERRHNAGSLLRRREEQCKMVGETLWESVPKPVRSTPQPGRNDPCSCGSGKKYKKCCLASDREKALDERSMKQPEDAAAAERISLAFSFDEDIDGYSNRVVDLIHKGDFVAAEKACEELEKKFPDSVDCPDRRAMLCEARGELQQAISYNERCLEIIEAAPKGSYETAFIYEEAIVRLRSALAAKSNNSVNDV